MEGRSKKLSHTKPSVPVRRDQTISCEKKDRDICSSQQGRTVILMRLPPKSENVRPHFSNSTENATPLQSIQSWKCDPIQRHIPISLLGYRLSSRVQSRRKKSHMSIFSLFLPAIFAGPRFVGIHKFCYTGKMITINKFRTCTVLTSYTYLRRGQCKLKTYQEMASLYHKWIFPLVHCLTGSPGQCQDDRQQLPPLEARTRAHNRS